MKTADELVLCDFVDIQVGRGADILVKRDHISTMYMTMDGWTRQSGYPAGEPAAGQS